MCQESFGISLGMSVCVRGGMIGSMGIMLIGRRLWVLSWGTWSLFWDFFSQKGLCGW